MERFVIDDALRETATRVLDLFRARGLKLATAESCTGGLVAATLTEIAGSSDVVDCGFVTYSNEAKQNLLGVPAATLKRHGAVSGETATAMAAGALKNSQADDGRRIASSRRYGKIGRRRVRQRSVAEAFELLRKLAEND
jgi:nicotinamide-nucleotide amidase